MVSFSLLYVLFGVLIHWFKVLMGVNGSTTVLGIVGTSSILSF